MLPRKELANAIRFLSIDAIQQAKSGHPGAPMGMADIAQVLWSDYLNHNPNNPNWPNRDRFVLSNGHASMLIYSLLHLSGYDLSIDDLKRFRQLHSPAAGHPELGEAPGIETTTGPLGQGLGNAVGMAMAEKILAGQFNRPGHTIVDHYTYVFAGDGCLMEGISHEVCSLAGTQGLGKLIVFYDDNGISIDGNVEGWFTDDTPKRFESYGWHVVPSVDGHDADDIKRAIEEGRNEQARPTLICCKTIIGRGAPNKEGSSAVHGAALGAEEIEAARAHLNWNHPPFSIPKDIYSAWSALESGFEKEQQWSHQFQAYRKEHPQLAREFERRIKGELPAAFSSIADEFIETCQQKGETIATRKASQNSLDVFGNALPELLGGSADLAGSNNTFWNGCTPVSNDKPEGNYIHYGVREFGMSAMMNGLALHGGFVPYAATFLVFMEYARNALRMAALMKQRAIYVYTHDSIGLGEDGPTHQPVEQLTNLRTTPNLETWRPCDTVESAVAWKAAIERTDGPSALIFSRQALHHQQRTGKQLEQVARGAYVLHDTLVEPDLILIATGSEVGMTMEAAHRLEELGIGARVVSMPCAEAFDKQPESYRFSVLPQQVKARIAIEAGHSAYWYKYVGHEGEVVGMDCFGASAPADQLYEYFGITVEEIVRKAKLVTGYSQRVEGANAA